MSTNPYTPILFYSERCPNSKEVIGTIQALNKASLFRFVSVDTTPRHLMPPELKSVPTVIFPDSKQVLVGKANIFAHLSKPVQSRREVPTARAEPAKPAEPLFWSSNESTMSSGYSSFDGTTKTPEDQLRDQFSRVDRDLEALRNRNTLGELALLVQDGLHGIDRIAEIVLNLKDFSRLDRLKVQVFDVNHGIESTLLLARHLLKNAEVRKVFGTLPPVVCAASQVNQVFLNLVTNAAQAIEERGQGKGLITLTTKAVGHSVMIEVRDNGKGIPPDVLPRIFDPFFTTKETGKGTGLGLSISFKIIDQHKGKILVHSRVGEGTTFTVLLPASQPSAAADAPEDATSGGQSPADPVVAPVPAAQAAVDSPHTATALLAS
jgi:hypothetical protein